MKAPSYINLHTHWSTSNSHSGEGTVFNLLNTYPQEREKHQLPAISCGIHPWSIRPGAWKEAFSILQELANQPQVMAIGECGLDALKGPDMGLQKEVFLKQLELAIEVKKPVIIHCVKAFEELLHLVQSLSKPPLCIVHGFQKSPELAQDLLKRGFYLSLGSVFLKTPEQMPDYRALPLDRIFLETDDRDISIQTIYQRASHYWQISDSALMEQIQQNFNTVFHQHA